MVHERMSRELLAEAAHHHTMLPPSIQTESHGCLLTHVAAEVPHPRTSESCQTVSSWSGTLSQKATWTTGACAVVV